MECIFLAPYKRGEKPDPAPVHWLTDDENFSDAPELDTLGKVFDQDVFNMGKVQLGLETTQKTGWCLVIIKNQSEMVAHKLSECAEKRNNVTWISAPVHKALYVKNGDGNIEVTDGDLKVHSGGTARG